MSIALAGHSGQIGVGDELGKTGTVKLSELNTTHATTRTLAAYGYKRVNQNEEARNQAPAPGDAQSETLGNQTANSLAKWNGYLQWSESEEIGTNMNLHTKICATATSCRAIFSFDRPPGYTNFTDPTVQQEFYIKLCSNQSQGAECDDDPLTGTRYQLTDAATADTGYHSALHENKWYIGTVRMQWDDTGDGSFNQTGLQYTAIAQGSMSNGGNNQVDAITFQMPAAPVCIANSCGLGNSRENACFDVGGATNAYRNATGGLSAGDTVYNSGCGSVITSAYIAFGDPEDSYPISGGTIVNSPVECEF